MLLTLPVRLVPVMSRAYSGGRGAYYKAKYGSKRPRDDTAADGDEGKQRQQRTSQRLSGDDLAQRLRDIDGHSYGAYKRLYGEYDFGTYSLLFDHIQADAFAPPSCIRVRVPQSVAAFPEPTFSNPIRNIALCDFLTRRFGKCITDQKMDVRQASQGWAGAKGGDIGIAKPGQYVLKRNSVLVDRDTVEARFTVGLPAQGRTVLARQCSQLLVDQLPAVIKKALQFASIPEKELWAFLHSVEDQESLRAQLADADLVAFVGNGSLLPRKSGVDDSPLPRSKTVAWQSPASMQVSFTLPHAGTVHGTGIRRGVTLIVGGGFHGKSTLLQALEVGAYNKVPGDGRERVVTDPSVVKVRAEDGRYVSAVDITPFINNLPFQRDTSQFSTEDASGSTSMAASIQEMLEAGSRGLLFDEDTSATNFLIRDDRMQQLVPKAKEPITPLIFKVRKLLDEKGVSSILVVGGCGDYLSVADQVIGMESYTPLAVSERVHVNTVDRLAVLGTELDLTHVDQLVDMAQTRTVAESLRGVAQGAANSRTPLTLEQVLDSWERAVAGDRGLDSVNVDGRVVGTYALPRRFELAAAINRLRAFQFKSLDG
ncbi:hypothetical protein RI367_005208 [Sorochytrium milnesiophthora]